MSTVDYARKPDHGELVGATIPTERIPVRDQRTALDTLAVPIRATEEQCERIESTVRLVEFYLHGLDLQQAETVFAGLVKSLAKEEAEEADYRACPDAAPIAKLVPLLRDKHGALKVKNVLERLGIDTVGNLRGRLRLQDGRRELITSPNVGVKTIADLYLALAEFDRLYPRHENCSVA